MPIAVSGSDHPRKINQLTGRCHRQHASKSASRAVLSRVQLTLHATHPTPHDASLLVQATSTWPVKTRRAPSRHCRVARVYCHTATAMHDMSAPSPTAVRAFFTSIAKRVLHFLPSSTRRVELCLIPTMVRN